MLLGEDFCHLLSLARFLSVKFLSNDFIFIDHSSEIIKIVGHDKFYRVKIFGFPPSYFHGLLETIICVL